MRRAVLGDDHYMVSYDLSRLALFFARQGRLYQAEALFRQSLPTVAKVFGTDHPAVLEGYLSLANTLRQRQASDEAETLYRQVLEALLSYADLLQDTGRSEQAKRSRLRAEAIQNRPRTN